MFVFYSEIHSENTTKESAAIPFFISFFQNLQHLRITDDIIILIYHQACGLYCLFDLVQL
jgi:hypothetical protein